MIYLDNAATTPLTQSALEAMQCALSNFYNPSSLYAPALEVSKKLDKAREAVAGKLKCRKNEVFFTSCATESNNWAFECGIKNKKGNVVVSAGEHASVFECAQRLKSRGVDVRFAPLTKSGVVDFEKYKKLIDSNTAFVSAIHCSNETGAVNDIAALCRYAKAVAPQCVFHSDGVQAFCKLDTVVSALGVELYSASAHKIGGPKGVGCLYVREGFHLPPFILGGGQEKALRSGTENVAGILGFAAAAEALKADKETAAELRDCFKNKLMALPDVKINGDEGNSGFILSVSILGVRSEILQHILCDKGILIGLGSACASKSRGNRVLGAMGVENKYIDGSIRISFLNGLTKKCAEDAAAQIVNSIKELRGRIDG